MKKCVIVSDSFKGTLSSMEICEIARETIPQIFPDYQVDTIPVADGGEGTVACFQEAIGAEPVEVHVQGPYGEPLEAVYARKGDLAIIEMAAAAGLPLASERKNPEQTTTYGLGQIILHAVSNGCRKLLLGLGGSCTNDGGCGCAAALGTCFLDEMGNSFVPTGETLRRICRIDIGQTRALLENVSITVMCDVENPLCGPTGAAAVFGPQKGRIRRWSCGWIRALGTWRRLYSATLDVRWIKSRVAELRAAWEPVAWPSWVLNFAPASERCWTS